MLTKGCVVTFMLMSGLFFLFRRRDRLGLLLGAILMFWFLIYVKDISLCFLGYEANKHTEFYVLTDMWAIPTCFIMMIEVLRPGKINVKTALTVFSPFIVVLLLYIYNPSAFIFQIGIWVILCAFVAYVVFISICIPYFHIRIKQQYSSIENLNLNWMWLILIQLVLFFFVWGYSRFFVSDLISTIYYLCAMAMWTCVLFFIDRYERALKATQGADFVPMDEENLLENNDNTITQYHFIDRLNELFEQDKIYLNPKLTINDLAYDLKTNRTYVSDYINTVLKINFFDFVNEYRLKYSAELLRDNPMLTLEQVAEQSGFNSLSTFRRSFQKLYQCTPHEYRKSCRILI